VRSFYGPFSRTTLVSSAASQTNESEAEIVPAAEGLQGRLGRCRLGRTEHAMVGRPDCRVEGRRGSDGRGASLPVQRGSWPARRACACKRKRQRAVRHGVPSVNSHIAADVQRSPADSSGYPGRP
jgi:hypothetical protein